MDEADMAEAQREAAQAMADRARHNRESAQLALGPEECEECGDGMPLLRRQWGLLRCVGCQSAKEKLWKHFGRAYD